jgi:Kef-type K+ transport system membrane component KefB
MNIIVLIAIFLSLALIISEIFHRLKYPRVIGHIFTGILLGLPFIRIYFSSENLAGISFLSELGIVFLLLLVGLEVDLIKLRKASRDSLIIAISAAVIPFIFGFITMKVMGYPNIIAAVLGASLSLTAEGTTIVVLIEMKVLKTRVGTIMLGAGILDDIFEVLFLSLLLVYINESKVHLSLFPISIITFVITIYLIIKFIPKTIDYIRKEKSRVSDLTIILVIGLSVAALSQLLGLGPIIGAFIGGIFVQWIVRDKKFLDEIIEELKILTFSLIIPFFFINIGLHFDFNSILVNPILFFVIFVVAVLSKIIGAIIVTKFCTLNLRQMTLVGWAMNSRGAIELVIAELARANNLIPIEIYSAIIAMTIITTLMFPFVLKYYLYKYPDIMR